MSYARDRVTQEYLRKCSFKTMQPVKPEPKPEPEPIDERQALEMAALTLTLEKEWKHFRQHSQWMQEKYEEFEARGADLESDKEWLKIVRRFEKNVLAPLERKYKEIQGWYGLHEDRGQK